MSSIAPDIREKMMHLLKNEEANTDLENLAVLSQVGMKVADATSSELDADAISASSTALIDLGLRLNQATDHGALTEIILHNSSGYSILIMINREYIVFGGLREVYRIGYYLGYLRELARKLNVLISGNEDTEMALSWETSELQKAEKEEEEVSALKKPSVEQDKAALDDLLGFLDDWEKEDEEFEEIEVANETNIVSIPKSIGIGIEKEVIEAEINETTPHLVEESPPPEASSGIDVYEDEVPPVPLDEYSPMEIEDESVSEDKIPVDELKPPEKAPVEESLPSLSELPSLEELAPPDFDVESSASEYDTEFVLEEESEALGSVLKELGWSEDED
jgi:predicted regulator of Ras-like GTPase activity (Roadblock/LC7/MglB family)